MGITRSVRVELKSGIRVVGMAQKSSRIEIDDEIELSKNETLIQMSISSQGYLLPLPSGFALLASAVQQLF